MPLDPAAGAARGLAAASGHQGVSLIGLGKPGRLRVDQPTITGELGPAPDAYTHYSPVMIAALSKDCQTGALLMKVGLFSVGLGAISASISSGQRHAFLETLSALSGAAVFGAAALRQEQMDREACPTAWKPSPEPSI